MKEVSIQSTQDYSIFQEITSNREVDNLHVKHLKVAIEENNLLHLNPIIVNSDYQVIDGQHRLQAATELEVPIYYIVDDKVNKQHIAKLNSNQKNWTILDYVNYYAIEKVPEYMILSDFICRHPQIPPSTMLTLLHPKGERSPKEFKEGIIDVSNQEQANEILNTIEKIRNLGIEIVYDRPFILAIREAFKVEGFRVDQFLIKLENNRIELFKCAKTKQYLQLIEQIYNKHNHQSNKLRFW